MRIALLAALVLSWTVGPASAANGWWTFDRDTNLNSRLTWKWTYPPSPAEYSRSWRGGGRGGLGGGGGGRGGGPARRWGGEGGLGPTGGAHNKRGGVGGPGENPE